MSVTNKQSSSIRQAGNTIAGPNFTSIYEQSAILNNRTKPTPALFSRKNLNYQYNTETTWKTSAECSKISPGNSPNDTLASPRFQAAVGSMGATESTLNAGARASRFPTKQGKKFSLNLHQNVSHPNDLDSSVLARTVSFDKAFRKPDGGHVFRTGV